MHELPGANPAGLSDGYRPDIDGLRAVAVLAVLAYHAFPRLVGGGFVGVDVFFVISGYLITGIILDGLARDRFTLGWFYARRVRRLFPALVLVLAACFALGWFTLLPNEYEQLAKHTASAAGFVSNFVLWKESGYFDSDAAVKPLLHLWTLAIEEQFYLLWPSLILIARRLGLCSFSIALFVTLASFALNVHSIGRDAVAAFYSPASRFWELTLGGVLAHLLRPADAGGVGTGSWSMWLGSFMKRVAAFPDVAAAIGLLLVLASVFGLTPQAAFPGWWALAPTVGTVLLIAAGRGAWLSRRLLSSRPIVFVGLISYPLYLWHWPLLSFGHILGPDSESLSMRAGALLGAFALAWLTYALVEKPIRFGAHGMRNVPGLVLSMSIVGALGLATFWNRGLEFRALAHTPQLVRKYAALRYDFKTDARYGSCWLSKDDAGDAFSSRCVDADGGGDLIAVWGDSHAARLFPGLRAALGETHRLAQFTRDGCPPLLDFGYDNCARGNAAALARLAGAKPATMILFAAWNRYGVTWGSDDEGSRRLLQTLDALRQAGVARVLLVGPAPQWGADLPRVLMNLARRDKRFHLPPARTRARLDDRVRACDDALERWLAGRPGVAYASAWRVFCDGDGCLTRVDESAEGLTTWDDGHLTTRAAEYLARRLPL